MITQKILMTNRWFLFQLISRQVQSTVSGPRVRFAPSPTGFLHVGGLRTALLNYIFARSKRGQFILRIEDTDQTRTNPLARNDIHNSLEWANLVPDEGPGYGGKYGPYTQSERVDLYHSCVNDLLSRGKAYRCYCSADRLELLRRDQRRRQETPRYDGKCRSLDPASVLPGAPSVVRFKLENKSSVIDDLVLGRVTIDIGDVEGDPVILKSDGMPVYHLANVVDDHHMAISHVIRGMEWLPSTPKHLQLYEAFGWDPPKFVHLPLLLNDENNKISKRSADYSFYLVSQLRANGYIPEAVLSWIMSSGGGFQNGEVWYPEITLDELVSKVDLSRLTTHSARLSKDSLKSSGMAHFDKLVASRSDQLVHMVSDYIKSKGGDVQLDSSTLLSHLSALRHRVSYMGDLENYLFLWYRPTLSSAHFLSIHNDRKLVTRVLTKALDAMTSSPSDDWTTSYKDVCSRSIAMPIYRIALTGQMQGLRIPELLELLSIDEICQRFSNALDSFNSQTSVA